MDAAEFQGVYQSFAEFHSFFSSSFGRKQWREHSRHYLQALLVQSQKRRNAENLSESVGPSARALQRFLTESPWDDDAVMGRLQEYLGPRLEHPEAVWVLDGSDFPKQGSKSAGVARQYCGRLGKVANCQAGIRPDQAGAGIPAVPAEEPGEGEPGVAANLHRAQPAQAVPVRGQSTRQSTGQRPHWEHQGDLQDREQLDFRETIRPSASATGRNGRRQLTPGSDGMELMKDIREVSDVPVIFLSVNGQEEVVARAFDMGAADYVVKPFSATELAQPSEPCVRGALTVDYAQRRVTVAGNPVELTDIEYRMLGEDASNPASIFAVPRVGYRMEKGEEPEGA